MSKYYIAGPMRGKPFYNFPAFDKARDMLVAEGHEVISPADLDREAGFNAMVLPLGSDWNKIPEGFSFHDCVTRDLKAVRDADRLYVLEGWQTSKGAKAEIAVAEWMGKRIEYQISNCDGAVEYTLEAPTPARLLPTDAEERKTYPIFAGLLEYFPHACAAVAHHSYVGNQQHNPGEPLHWAKEKSIGNGDQIVRHLMEGDLEACSWRSLELLERKLTKLPPFDK